MNLNLAIKKVDELLAQILELQKEIIEMQKIVDKDKDPEFLTPTNPPPNN